ncbi:hypothetical protein FB45DRAFT_1017916 [Roridomyces roridus]|uniref:Uncharacterized protein n=1 Tax=Roridomyces roridus TaxID=1738132 RepID=A0AAD7CJI2_9AGAR|nr:hypothetical protein FB45DRAFT_1017916 [Roridomyces roridus]
MIGNSILTTTFLAIPPHARLANDILPIFLKRASTDGPPMRARATGRDLHRRRLGIQALTLVNRSGEEDEAEMLTAHMQLLLHLRSAHARHKTNDLFATDPALLSRHQRPIAAAKLAILDLQKEEEEWRREALELEQQLQAVHEQSRGYDDEIRDLDPTTSRKHPRITPVVGMQDIPATVDNEPKSDAQLVQQAAQSVHPQPHPVRAPNQPHTTMPKATAPAEELAMWIQGNLASDVKGVPVHGLQRVVDLRDARGHQAMMKLIRPVGRQNRGRERKERRACLMAVLSVLIIPRRYEHLLRTISAPIANSGLSPLNIGLNLESEEAIVRELAKHGLTAAVANDMWQYCLHLVKAELQGSSSPVDKEKLMRWIDLAESHALEHGEPPGIPA